MALGFRRSIRSWSRLRLQARFPRTTSRDGLQTQAEVEAPVGLWVGRNLDSNQHLVIPLDAYDSIADEYVLGKLLSVSTVRVFDDQFPLRCIPTGDSDLVKFNDFVDRFDPLYQHAPIERVMLI